MLFLLKQYQTNTLLPLIEIFGSITYILIKGGMSMQRSTGISCKIHEMKP